MFSVDQTSGVRSQDAAARRDLEFQNRTVSIKLLNIAEDEDEEDPVREGRGEMMVY